MNNIAEDIKIRNWNIDDSQNMNWAKLLLRLRKKKALQFITRDGQVVPIGGPSAGGGNATVGGSAVSLVTDAQRNELNDWEAGEAKTIAEFAFMESPKVIGIRSEDKLIGVAGYSEKGAPSYRNPGFDSIELEFVSTNTPGKGIGTALTKTVIQEAAKQGKGLTLVSENEAIPFYQKLGMHPVNAEGFTWFYLTPQECKEW